MTSGVSKILLEKAASDNGFDLVLDQSGIWLSFASSHAPLKLWLTVDDQSQFLISFSSSDLVSELAELATIIQTDLPPGAITTFSVTDIKHLYPMLRRAFQLSRSLPNEPLNEFRSTTFGLPKSTEAERLIIQRVGQNIFRNSLIDYWDGKCAMTKLSVLALLRASHIKPWKDCSTDVERLDVFNGLLLAPHLDAAFDLGFITLADDGSIILSSSLNDFAVVVLGIDKTQRVNGLTDAHQKYLKWHREKVFIC